MGRGVFCRDEWGDLSLGCVSSSLTIGVGWKLDVAVVYFRGNISRGKKAGKKRGVLQNRLDVLFHYPW
jgi:hypothetical protein